MSYPTPEQLTCEHVDIAWAPDELDGMCRACDLYLMKPNCIAETAKWWEKHIGPWGDWE